MAARERFTTTPLSLDDACGFVAMWHRHHAPPVGHKFSLGAVRGQLLVGVAIVGRPVARFLDNGRTLEVTRVAVADDARHACGYLYAAARKAAFALGYDRVITYNQDGESGASLRAAGYRVIAQRPARAGWNAVSRPREDKGTEHIARTLWEAS